LTITFSTHFRQAFPTSRQENFFVSTPHADAPLAAVDSAVDVDSTLDSARHSGYDTPLGITNPPIDELLDRASSKYALVIYAAKRARQINDYYNQLGDGILEYVGPLVEPVSRKPLTISMEEIEAGKIESAPLPPEPEEPEAPEAELTGDEPVAE